MPTPKKQLRRERLKRRSQHRPDMQKWRDTLDHLDRVREILLTDGISTDLNVAGFVLEVSTGLALYHDPKLNPLTTLKKLAKYWGGVVGGPTRSDGRISFTLVFPTYGQLCGFKDDKRDSLSLLSRVDSEHVYCVDLDRPVDSFIDLNPIPLEN
jgi:hypothetical protein